MAYSTELTSEEYRERQLIDFRRYRDTFTGDLPATKVMPGDTRYDMYKCRTNFFSAVYLRVNLLIQRGLLPDTFGWFQNYMERDRDWHKMANERDIAVIDDVIAQVIRTLEGSQSTTT